ncbi:MAG: glycosyltransferase family 2 protein [Ferruginibacter sp.]|nr:glycosyltransferase family 2 protein [Ferruginibacter sp.]
MQKISAVIITFNEEKKIATCLASLQGVVDEVVVMDSFSTDKTPGICKQYGAKLYQQNWKGYGSQKNDAAERASHDYILSLDADESLSPALQRSILQAKKAVLSGVYQMNRLNNFYGSDLHHGNSYPDATVRLYNRRETRWSLRSVHETLEISEAITIHKLKGDLLHKSKDTLEEHTAGISKYSTMGAKEYFEAGKKGAGFKVVVSPLFTFIKGYIFKLGFLDGFAGFMMAKMNSHEVFLKYSKLLLLQKNKSK